MTTTVAARRPPAARTRASAPGDCDLIEQIARGDPQGLGLLFRRHRLVIASLITRLGVNPADLDDLVQQTFLEVPRAARRFDPRHPVRAWLMGIAAVMVRRHRRSDARRATVTAAWARQPRLEASEGVEQKVGVHRALRALSGLSPQKRQVFVMVALDNVSGEEAARALGIPVATIWTRLRRARQELRQLV